MRFPHRRKNMQFFFVYELYNVFSSRQYRKNICLTFCEISTCTNKEGKYMALDNYYAKIFTFSSVDFIQVLFFSVSGKGLESSNTNRKKQQIWWFFYINLLFSSSLFFFFAFTLIFSFSSMNSLTYDFSLDEFFFLLFSLLYWWRKNLLRFHSDATHQHFCSWDENTMIFKINFIIFFTFLLFFKNFYMLIKEC